MEAYAIGPVPFSYLGSLIGMGWCGYRVLINRRELTGFLNPYWLLISWAVLVLLWTFVSGQYEDYLTMPPLSTTTYPVYVAIRYVNLVSFSGYALLFYDATRIDVSRTTRIAVNYAVLLCIAAYYLYYAPIYGFPELPRTRVATSGLEEQVVLFKYYGVQRAMGTFREPGGFAHWLLVPMTISFWARTRFAPIKRFVLALLMLLTGSFGAALSLTAGLGLAALMRPSFITRKFLGVLAAAVIVMLSLWVGVSVTYSFSPQETTMISILTNRAEELMKGGVRNTNRSYIYDYAEKHPPAALGAGYGNASLAMSRYFAKVIPDTFLSAYLYHLYSGGYIALLLLVVVLTRPLLIWRRLGEAGKKSEYLYLVGAYCAIAISHLANQDEVGVSLALCMGILMGKIELDGGRRQMSRRGEV
jgi:hypothetical protein